MADVGGVETSAQRLPSHFSTRPLATAVTTNDSSGLSARAAAARSLREKTIGLGPSGPPSLIVVARRSCGRLIRLLCTVTVTGCSVASGVSPASRATTVNRYSRLAAALAGSFSRTAPESASIDTRSWSPTPGLIAYDTLRSATVLPTSLVVA